MLLPLLLSTFIAADVQVEVLESGKTALRYEEAAFGFVRVPTKYSAEALPLDWPSGFQLRATLDRTLPAGQYRFRLRARGTATLTIDGRQVALTQPQKPNKSSDDPLPPPPVIDQTGHRPPPYPHQDVFAPFVSDGQPHRFVLLATIGGAGLMPTPGELSVSFASDKAGEIERLLGAGDQTPRLLDSDWEVMAQAQERRHRQLDRERRLAASRATVAAWEARHEKVREHVRALPPLPHSRIDQYLPTAQGKPVSDLEFLRRLTLDTLGQIPSLDEIRSYLADPPTSRRQKAITRLLADPGWADHWVSYWQDVLAENPGILKPDLNNTGPFRYWIHQSFQDRVPFDRFVAELVNMDGSKTMGGPAAFSQATLNDAPMAQKAEVLSQAFLAQRMGCARCHDAPFHPYKQKDLFSLAAMLKGSPLQLPVTSTVPLVEGARRPAVKITLKSGDSIAPEWPFANLIQHADASAIPAQGSVPSRREVAAFLIAPENDRFAKVLVNRLWKRYLGTGLVEPADDWFHAKPENPELLEFLSRQFLLSGYDLAHVAKLIFESAAYQRAPQSRRKMSAEQLVDSLHRASGKEFLCEELNLNPAGDRPATQFLNLGRPERAWEMTALSNERDRPSLALPMAQSLVDILMTYGWRQSRQSPVTTRDDAASPMQTLILANGALGMRMVRLTDDSAFTALAVDAKGLREVIETSFLRILSRPPTGEEVQVFQRLLEPHWKSRLVAGAASTLTQRKSDRRVSWSTHFDAEATLIRMREEREAQLGEPPTARLTPEFRERYEDALWALVNSPEFVLLP
ncbi:MAG: DUF1553 domain-containing protein [Acidobacteria bacterium]|nr:DUF1553 domain-containing protein [Acidobacteriota bacterium]